MTQALLLATTKSKPQRTMLGFLFRGLTAQPARGEALFAAVTAEARRRSWYVDGAVPDTLDGRFAVLATIMALVLVRLEREGERGHAASVALTERFIQVMESEHRELGLGDPTLGKTVRKLVGMLARRKNKFAESAICSLLGLRVLTTTGLPRRNFSVTEFIFRKSTAAAAKSRNALGVIRSINVVAIG